MDVFAFSEGLNQDRILCEVSKDSKLDLGIVSTKYHAVFLAGDEDCPDFSPFLCPDRDVLQVRITAREAAGGSNGLIKGCVNPSCLRVYQSTKRIGIGAL